MFKALLLALLIALALQGIEPKASLVAGGSPLKGSSNVDGLDGGSAAFAMQQRAMHAEMLRGVVGQIVGRPPGQRISLRRKPQQSHCPRPHAYKNNSLQIDLSSFTQVMSLKSIESALVDDGTGAVKVPEKFKAYMGKSAGDVSSVAEVQAMVNMEQLVDALLPYKLVPLCVPEFKGITAGGAIQGLAAESTSFKFGFFHDTVLGFEAVLCDGSVLWCSDCSNRELFHSLPGSFGSIALITRVKLLCMRADDYILLRCIPREGARSCLQLFKQLQDEHCSGRYNRESDRTVFAEGFGFSESNYCAVLGHFASSGLLETPQGARRLEISTCSRPGDLWFFNLVRSVMAATNSRRGAELPEPFLLMPTKEYLFRHDRGAFWMASYRIPQQVGKYMGGLLDSSSMFQLATALPMVFPKSQICLQDFMLPRENCELFIHKLQHKLQLFPLWLLPMRNLRERRAVFSSPDTRSHLCNVGAYGIPRNKYSFARDNRALEKILHEGNGRKVYYSHNYYDRDFFYNELYDGKRYFALRDKYKVRGCLPEIFDKIATVGDAL